MRALLFSVFVAGCGSSVETPATEAGLADSATVDTGSSADGSGSDAICEVGTAPATAPYAYEFVFLGGDAGASFPTPTGGDPTGEWRYTKLTIYLSDSARSLVDVSKSSVVGKGYAKYTATNFLNVAEQKIVIETTVVGTVTRGSANKARGTYKVEGKELVFTPECVESTVEGSLSRVGFSRIDPDHARIQFKPPPTGMGDFNQQIVIDMEKVK